MQSTRNLLGWCIALAIWISGAVGLWKIWQFQKSLQDPLGSYLECALMLASTFYVLLMFPIRFCVNRLLCRFDGKYHPGAAKTNTL